MHASQWVGNHSGFAQEALRLLSQPWSVKMYEALPATVSNSAGIGPGKKGRQLQALQASLLGELSKVMSEPDVYQYYYARPTACERGRSRFGLAWSAILFVTLLTDRGPAPASGVPGDSLVPQTAYPTGSTALGCQSPTPRPREAHLPRGPW